MEKYNVDKSLYIVIPCYNEEAVLPITAPMFLNKNQQPYRTRTLQR